MIVIIGRRPKNCENEIECWKYKSKEEKKLKMEWIKKWKGR
jgi:hypothetical protein